MTNNFPNLFIYGLSGSGKDTLSNYLRNHCDYLKLRIAGTIKQFVFETYGFENQEEFDKQKRLNPEVRKAHNIFGKEYDTKGIELSNVEATTNRLKALVNRTALEFEITNDMESKPICIVDVRTKFEADFLLKHDFVGIFLSRRNDEYADSKHKTEQNMFTNGELLNLFEENQNSMKAGIIVFNWKTENDETKEIEKTFNAMAEKFDEVERKCGLPADNPLIQLYESTNNFLNILDGTLK